ncbi:MAG: DNA repair protein RadC, partial [Acidobacteria bacterium]|nr:DNA repair protein RadC [Acidobacteriota bacterium]
MSIAPETTSHPADGHRRRLRERFRRRGGQALADYELLELLLSFAIPRRDTKPLAHDLLHQAGCLSHLFRQGTLEWEQVTGFGAACGVLMELVRELWRRALEASVEPGRRISSPEDVAAYLQAVLGTRVRESVMLLCLNAANTLIHQEIVAEGTINHAPVYPREVARLALLRGATAVILVHNHPGGQCSPSPEDLQLTRHLADVLGNLGIQLHDHLVVTDRQVYSITAG